MKKIQDIRFNLTKEMYDLIIEIIIINQILNQKINKYEKDTLLKQKNVLLKKFIREFQLNNEDEIIKYKELIDTKN